MVDWRKLFFRNISRPRVIFTLWMVFQNCLLTKDSMRNHGLITNGIFALCNLQESCHQLFFECAATKEVWKHILAGIGDLHNPGGWKTELAWIIQQTRGKGSRIKLLKMVIAETVYHIWTVRNKIIFQNCNKDIFHSKHIREMMLGRIDMDRELVAYCDRM
ncbi:unnamed protein product [Lathyrus sativus]|nr:unnamed protein product [Lathyrus sativus]